MILSLKLIVIYLIYTVGMSEPKRVQSPKKDSWKPGDPQPHPYQGSSFTTFNPQEIASSYFLGISGVVPRPIALTSTVSSKGQRNVAPFSYFNIVAHNPPTLVIGICRKLDGSKKDTLVNIEETGEFVVNIISDWMVEAANHCCGDFPFEVDEMELSGLTPLPSEVVAPPRIGESAFHMECKHTHSQEIISDSGAVTTTVVFGRVVRFHVIENLVEAGINTLLTPSYALLHIR
jgi:flavin reductase (DIM6/NTAB) family NADH-FMN oxidoreductase RutF